MSAWDRLAQIQDRAEKATNGPWELTLDGEVQGRRPGFRGADPEMDPIVGCLDEAQDNEFIAHARADVPTLVAALRAVQDGLGPHYDSQVRRNAKFGRIGSDCVCEGCNTYRAVENALKENR